MRKSPSVSAQPSSDSPREPLRPRCRFPPEEERIVRWAGGAPVLPLLRGILLAVPGAQCRASAHDNYGESAQGFSRASPFECTGPQPLLHVHVGSRDRPRVRCRKSRRFSPEFRVASPKSPVQSPESRHVGPHSMSIPVPISMVNVGNGFPRALGFVRMSVDPPDSPLAHSRC